MGRLSKLIAFAIPILMVSMLVWILVHEPKQKDPVEDALLTSRVLLDQLEKQLGEMDMDIIYLKRHCCEGAYPSVLDEEDVIKLRQQLSILKEQVQNLRMQLP